MATVLMTWEMGVGLEYAMELRMMASGLVERGYKVVLAVRDLDTAAPLFSGMNVEVEAAPRRMSQRAKAHATPRAFAHLLANEGMGYADELEAKIKTWRQKIQFLDPDLIIFNHSPMALLAARPFEVSKVMLGMGFCCPPGGEWLPAFTRKHQELCEIQDDETRLLASVNGVLASLGDEPLEAMPEIYRQVDQSYLTTLPPLDPYPNRAKGTYCGPWGIHTMNDPNWPQSRGVFGRKRVYVSLTQVPVLLNVLETLKELHCIAVVSTEHLSKEWRENLAGQDIRFSDASPSVQQLADICDMAVLDGDHNHVVQCLLAGIPVMCCPLTLEHAATSQCVVDCGAGLSESTHAPVAIKQALRAVLKGKSFRKAAKEFAREHSYIDPHETLSFALDSIQILGGF